MAVDEGCTAGCGRRPEGGARLRHFKQAKGRDRIGLAFEQQGSDRFDPDIALQGPGSADSQIPRISDATGIPASTLQAIVNQNVEGVWWVFGSPYVNVQRVNLVLINEFPSVYANYTA